MAAGEPKMKTKTKTQGCLIILGISVLWIFLKPGQVANNETTLEANNEISLKANEGIASNAIPVFTLDLESEDPKTYKNFLTEIRNNVKDPKLRYGDTDIPVIAARTPSETYLRINLQLSAGNTVSLAVRRTDLYVIAYLTKNERQVYHAYYFPGEISTTDLGRVFTESNPANRQEITEYTENYGRMETAAKMTRKQAGLGIGKLKFYINGVYRVARNVQNEARFMIVGAGMVAEGARFGFIENQVVENYPQGFTPDDKVTILENDWAKISKAIKKSDHGVFSPPLELRPTWIVHNADELNMGILKYIADASP